MFNRRESDLIINLIYNFMSIICCHCGDDIDAKNQDNMSHVCGAPKCEDCYNEHKKYRNSKPLGYSSEDLEELSTRSPSEIY